VHSRSESALGCEGSRTSAILFSVLTGHKTERLLIAFAVCLNDRLGPQITLPGEDCVNVAFPVVRSG
jgi:hypothetical protein